MNFLRPTTLICGEFETLPRGKAQIFLRKICLLMCDPICLLLREQQHSTAFKNKKICRANSPDVSYLSGLLFQWNIVFCKVWAKLVFISAALLVLLPSAHAGCTDEHWCRNEYNSSTREFYRIAWGLTEIPKDIPHEAVLINLWENSITSLPANVFAPFTSLKSLFLYRNTILSIDANAFSGLRALEWLDLNSNRLFGFPTEMFTPLESLKVLDLRFNPFYPFNAGTFASLKSLEELRFYRNNLRAVHPGTFSGLVSLKKLVLAGNALYTLPPGIFAELRSLEYLDLAVNQFTGLDPAWFMGLGSLKELALFENDLTSLPHGIFGHMPLLEALDIATNNLISIPRYVLSGLDNLTAISLGGNPMTTLDSRAFANLPRPFKLSMKNMWEPSPVGWDCSTLCWLRDEERKGTVRLVHWTLGYHVTDDSSLPFCAEEGQWDTMQCAHEGELLGLMFIHLKVFSLRPDWCLWMLSHRSWQIKSFKYKQPYIWGEVSKFAENDRSAVRWDHW